MDELRQRPLVLVAAGLAIGVAAHYNALVVLLLLAGFATFRDLRIGGILVTSFAVGAIVGGPQAKPLLERTWVDSEAVVVSVPRNYPASTTCEIAIDSNRLLMTAPLGERFVLGDRLRVRGVARPFREGTEGKRLLRHVVGRIRPLSIDRLGSGPWIYGLGAAWRESFVAFCERTLSPRVAAAIEAVCFNVDTALDPEDLDAMRRSGTIHVVSASGLHVAILAGALALVLSATPVPRPAQIAILLLVLGVYAAATGMRPPILRAGMMALALAPAYLVRREPDALSAIAFAASVQMVFDPTSIHDIGFQLSFLVVAALVLFSPEMRNLSASPWRRAFDWTGHKLQQGLVATLAAAPLVAYHFGLVSLTSLPANLLLALSIPVMVLGGLAAHTLSLVVPAVGVGIMVALVDPMAKWLYVVLEWFGGEWAAASIPTFSGYWVALAYALALAVWRPRLRPA